jgi:predicted cobalt transporter CbtA
MDGKRLFHRITVVAATTGVFAGLALPALSADHRTPTAVQTWSASYQAKEKVYRAQLAADAAAHTMPPAAVATWSESYRVKGDLYQRQQLARAERAAGAFHWGDALVGGGAVLGLAALAFGMVVGLRRGRPAPLSS